MIKPRLRLCIALVLLGQAIPAGAAAADASPEWRARFGVLADMAGKDFLYYNGSSAFGGLRVEWIKPGATLRIVDFQGKRTTDCKLSLSPNGEPASGQCFVGEKRQIPLRFEVTSGGGVKLQLVNHDALFGDHASTWLNFQPGDAPGEYFMPVALDKYKVRPFPADISGWRNHFVQWVPEAMAKAGHVMPIPVAANGPQAAPVPQPQPEPPPGTIDLPPM